VVGAVVVAARTPTTLPASTPSVRRTPKLMAALPSRSAPPELALREGDTVSVELEHDGDRLAVHACVVNLGGDEAGEKEIGLQFLVTDDALNERLSAFVKALLEGCGAA